MELSRLPASEQLVMKTLWLADAPLRLTDVTRLLEAQTGWHKGTVLVHLNRLCEKGFVSLQTEENRKSYTPAITRDAYTRFCTADFLRDICDGSLSTLVSALSGSGALDPQEVAQILKEYEEKNHDN